LALVGSCRSTTLSAETDAGIRCNALQYPVLQGVAAVCASSDGSAFADRYV